MLGFLLAGLLLISTPMAAQAASWSMGDNTPAMTGHLYLVDQDGGRIGPGEAARVARSAYGGRVLAVHMANGGRVYRVRLLIGGQVRVVLVDARTGRLLR